MIRELYRSSVQNKDISTFKSILDKNKNININYIFSEYQRTLLHTLCILNEVDMVRLLLTHPNTKDRININILDELEDTPLAIACDRGYIEIVKLLLENPDVNKNDYMSLGLITSIESFNFDITKLLLSLPDININYSFHDVKNPISILVNHIHNKLEEKVEKEAFDILIDIVSRPDIDFKFYPDILFSIGSIIDYDSKFKDIYEKLVFNPEVDINYKFRNNRTALITACHLKSEYRIKLLLSNPKIDVNLVDEDGNTAFHILCQKASSIDKNNINYYIELFNLFINQKSLHKNIKNKKNHTILDTYIISNYTFDKDKDKSYLKIISLLLKNNFNFSETIVILIMEGTLNKKNNYLKDFWNTIKQNLKDVSDVIEENKSDRLNTVMSIVNSIKE